eukprot:COSAG04_NODE_25950_length_301_cov_1.014851_1_plen_37_part_01
MEVDECDAPKWSESGCGETCPSFSSRLISIVGVSAAS